MTVKREALDLNSGILNPEPGLWSTMVQFSTFSYLPNWEILIITHESVCPGTHFGKLSLAILCDWAYGAVRIFTPLCLSMPASAWMPPFLMAHAHDKMLNPKI